MDISKLPIKNGEKFSDVQTIDVIITHPVYGDIPFTADPNDIEKHGRDIHANLIAGNHGAVFNKGKKPK